MFVHRRKSPPNGGQLFARFGGLLVLRGNLCIQSGAALSDFVELAVFGLGRFFMAHGQGRQTRGFIPMVADEAHELQEPGLGLLDLLLKSRDGGLFAAPLFLFVFVGVVTLVELRAQRRHLEIQRGQALAPFRD